MTLAQSLHLKACAVILVTAMSLPLTLALHAQTAAPKHDTPNIARTKEAPTKAAQQERKFPFNVIKVEPESGTTMYRVEGLSADNQRFLLSCHSVSPVLKSREEILQWYDRYGGIDKYQKAAPEDVGFASIANGSLMTLYAYTGPFSLISQNCVILNRIANGEDVFSIEVISSELQNFKDGTGYTINAQTEEELLTLACTNAPVKVIEGPSCGSIAPKTYRATRFRSGVALYDADLNLVGDYVILSERKRQ